MEEFKVGDKVRLITINPREVGRCPINVGDVGEILKGYYYSFGTSYLIAWEGCTEGTSGGKGDGTKNKWWVADHLLERAP